MNNKITYYDYVKNFCNGKIKVDVSDAVIDMLVNYDFTIENDFDDFYDKAMTVLAKNVYIVDTNLDDRYFKNIILDFYGFCSDNYDKLLPLFNKHFYNYDSKTVKEIGKDEILADMVQSFEGIISGFASFNFYDDFVKVFSGNKLTSENKYIIY